MGEVGMISKRKLVHIETTEECYGALRMLISISEQLSDFIEVTMKHGLSHDNIPLLSEPRATQEMACQSDAGDDILASAAGTVNSSTKTSRSTEAPKKASQPSSLARRATQPVQAARPLTWAAKPFSKYVNLILCGLKPGQGRTGVTATILLDNPAGGVTLSIDAFVHNVQCIFGVRDSNIRMFHDSAFTKELAADSDVRCLAHGTIFVCPHVLHGVAPSPLEILRGPLCRYVNIFGKGIRGTLLLENPCGCSVTWTEVLAQASVILGKSARDIRLSRTGDSSGMLQCEDDTNLALLHGTTIFVL